MMKKHKHLLLGAAGGALAMYLYARHSKPATRPAATTAPQAVLNSAFDLGDAFVSAFSTGLGFLDRVNPAEQPVT